MRPSLGPKCCPRLTSFAADYLVLLTGREVRGSLFGKHIYRATDFKILPLSNSSAAMQHPVESHLLALVQSHLFGGTFYLSYEWDLTRRMQEQWEKRAEDGGRGLWEVVSHAAANRSFRLIRGYRQTTDFSGISEAHHSARALFKQLSSLRYLQSRLIEFSKANPDQDVRSCFKLMKPSTDLHFSSFSAKLVHPPHGLWVYVYPSPPRV